MLFFPGKSKSWVLLQWEWELRLWGTGTDRAGILINLRSVKKLRDRLRLEIGRMHICRTRFQVLGKVFQMFHTLRSVSKRWSLSAPVVSISNCRGVASAQMFLSLGPSLAPPDLTWPLLLPQLGKMRLTVPCRAVTCSHLQCFDAALYLQMNEKKPSWICPVCDKKAAYESLIIDGWVQPGSAQGSGPGRSRTLVLEPSEVLSALDLWSLLLILRGFFSSFRLFLEILNDCSDKDEIQFQQDGTWCPMKPKKESFKVPTPSVQKVERKYVVLNLNSSFSQVMLVATQHFTFFFFFFNKIKNSCIYGSFAFALSLERHLFRPKSSINLSFELLVEFVSSAAQSSWQTCCLQLVCPWRISSCKLAFPMLLQPRHLPASRRCFAILPIPDPPRRQMWLTWR